MVSVENVDQLISKELLDLGTEKVRLEKAVGRILKEDIRADRDFPPFNRVMMDGIAIQFAEWQSGTRKFKVEGLCPAGSPQKSLVHASGCLEVMTGAIMPQNADSVVKYEEVTLDGDTAIIDQESQISQGQHIHNQGTDRIIGNLLVSAGRIITPAEIAVLATVGTAEVEVARSPKVAIIATGDELVDVAEQPLPHQIRKSNVHSLVAALNDRHFVAEAFHFNDEKESLRTGLKSILDFFDVVVLSGGVSKGKLDYVPEILAELGVEKRFHFVQQRPGKPFWFGRYKTGVVFALPGNPVSTFVGMTRYVLPYLYRSTGIAPRRLRAVLTEDFTFKPDLTYFLQVKLEFNDQGELMAMPVPGQGSGDLANLLDADGFIELPATTTDFKAGEVFDCYPYRRMG